MGGYAKGEREAEIAKRTITPAQGRALAADLGLTDLTDGPDIVDLLNAYAEQVPVERGTAVAIVERRHLREAAAEIERFRKQYDDLKAAALHAPKSHWSWRGIAAAMKPDPTSAKPSHAESGEQDAV